MKIVEPQMTNKKVRGRRLSLVVVRDKLERALRNGHGAQFTFDEIRSAFVVGKVFEFICSQAAKEIAGCLETQKVGAYKSERSGCNGEPTEKFGRSPGMTPEGTDEHVASAASRRAAQKVDQLKALRRKQ